MDLGFPRYCALLFAEDPVQLLMQLDDFDLGLQLEIKMAELLDLSAAVFLGFFASRFDFLWLLAITAFLR
jgi:hypothetical protein